MTQEQSLNTDFDNLPQTINAIVYFITSTKSVLFYHYSCLNWSASRKDVCFKSINGKKDTFTRVLNGILHDAAQSN